MNFRRASSPVVLRLAVSLVGAGVLTWAIVRAMLAAATGGGAVVLLLTLGATVFTWLWLWALPFDIRSRAEPADLSVARVTCTVVPAVIWVAAQEDIEEPLAVLPPLVLT